jgi:uncharacterized membrane protein YdbT with pleckstrin-like domain
MWDINSKNLQSDETIKYTDQPSMLSCIISYIWVCFLLIGFVGNIIGAGNETDRNSSSLWVFMLFSLPAIYIILKRLSTRYVITTRGLLKRVGIITTSVKTVSFKHITSIEVKETIVGKIFGYAHLLIDTSGSGQGIEFKWKYVKGAHKVKKLIEKHIREEN